MNKWQKDTRCFHQQLVEAKNRAKRDFRDYSCFIMPAPYVNTISPVCLEFWLKLSFISLESIYSLESFYIILIKQTEQSLFL